jgi:2-phosphosulfolactate phosphatase
MRVEVAALPSLMVVEQLPRRTAIVFDVLRATTTMAAALHAGARRIVPFDSLESASSAARAFDGPRVLAGERNVLRPDGFDAGNSPPEVAALAPGRTVFMSTTNGTRAIVASASAADVLVAALVNASAAARVAASLGRDLTLVCSGTHGAIATEDLLGAGAVVAALRSLVADVQLDNDTARIAESLFAHHRGSLHETLWHSQGGQNIRRAGLESDVAFAARLDALPCVGRLGSGGIVAATVAN